MGDAAPAESDAPDRVERAILRQRAHQLAADFLTFAADDGVDPGLVAEDLAPEIGRMHAAIDDVHRGKRPGDRGGDPADDRLGGGRARMSEQHRIRGWRRTASARIASRFIGPNSASSRLTWCPSSISDPPMQSRP
jgi:hypothetical protein